MKLVMNMIAIALIALVCGCTPDESAGVSAGAVSSPAAGCKGCEAAGSHSCAGACAETKSVSPGAVSEDVQPCEKGDLCCKVTGKCPDGGTCDPAKCDPAKCDPAKCDPAKCDPAKCKAPPAGEAAAPAGGCGGCSGRGACGDH